MASSVAPASPQSDTRPRPREPGWYADPRAHHHQRYWDGEDWTTTTFDPPKRLSRRAARVRHGAVVASTVVAVTLALSSLLGHGTLALVAIGFALPLLITNVVELTRSSDRRPPRSFATVLGAWTIIAAIVAVGAYRGLGSTACASRLRPEADLAGCDLAGGDLSGHDLHDADLTGADLTGAKLDGVDLAGADLRGAMLRGTSFVRAALDGADLRGTVLDRVVLDDASMIGVSLQHAKLVDVRARRATLSGGHLDTVEVRGTDLTGALLDGAGLTDATIDHTALAGAVLSQARFTNASLAVVDLAGATLVDVEDLSDAALAGALGVSPLDVAKTLSDQGLFLEPEARTQQSASAACDGVAVPGAAGSASNGAFVVIVNNGSTTFAWPNRAPALRYVELVACVGPIVDVTVDQCGPYSAASGGVGHPITRYRENVTVQLVNPATAAILSRRTFDGPLPAPCPVTVSTSVYRVGADVDLATVDTGIAEMVAASGV